MALVELTTSEFADAIQKGLGRAILAIDGPVSAKFEAVIINACLVDQRHDHWFETGRAPYMMRIAEKAKLTDKLLPLLLAPLEENDGPREKRLRKFMLGEYALRGEEKAWEILREFAVNSDDVAWEVIADIGPIGLEWLANNIVEQLPTDEKYRVEYWKEDCHEALTPATENILEKAMKDFEEYRKHQPEYVPEAQPRTLDEALQEIRSKKPKTSPLRTLGKRFSHAEVLTVANLWLNEWDDQIGACYARLFEVRDFPMPIQFVADRVLTGNSPIDFENVLSAVNDPICRLLGLHLIEQSEPDWRGYTCLVSSFLDDDIPLLVDSLPKFVALDHGDLHDLCAALRDAAETIPSKLRTPILEWTYENNPCSFCRTQYAQMMLEDGTLSDFRRKELEFDASSESRQLVTK